MKRPRYADVAATLALVLALGGTSYAVTVLPRDSVGTAQIKANAVTKGKLAANVRTTGPAGPRGRDGVAGPTGPIGLTGAAGTIGLRGPAGLAGGPLDPQRIVHVNGQVVTVPPGQMFLNIAAPCPTGDIGLSGGYTIGGTVHVSSSIASDFQQGWQITVDNPGMATGTAQAFSVCLTT
ncbi:MAG TPA: hypothetical protein VGK92_10015 [Gaiellales bacterium]|jgi:hypothetical protein